MRITLELDDDVLLAVKDLARESKLSVSGVLSELARRRLASAVAQLGVPGIRFRH